MDAPSHKPPLCKPPPKQGSVKPRLRAASAVKWLTVSVVAICAVVLCGLFLWFHRQSLPTCIDQVALLMAWMWAPFGGMVVIALLYRSQLVASIFILVAAAWICGTATYLYSEYWWSNYRAELVGQPVMDVVLPIEMVGPIFHWMGVLATAVMAVIVSLATRITSSLLRPSRPDGKR